MNLELLKRAHRKIPAGYERERLKTLILFFESSLALGVYPWHDAMLCHSLRLMIRNIVESTLLDTPTRLDLEKFLYNIL